MSKFNKSRDQPAQPVPFISDHGTILATKVLLKNIIVLVEWAGYNQNNSEDCYITTLTNQAATDHN